MVNNGYTQCVESHKAEHSPVESLCLHHAADGDAQETFLTAEICRRTSLSAPDTRSGHGDAFGGGQGDKLWSNRSSVACSHSES